MRPILALLAAGLLATGLAGCLADDEPVNPGDECPPQNETVNTTGENTTGEECPPANDTTNFTTNGTV